MGAGQIGGIATLVDIDFGNAPGFKGHKAGPTEGQFVVYYLSHAMLFCVGAIIEAHVILTPAICVYGEKYKFDVYGGTHRFLEDRGIPRLVEHMCIHRAYNHTARSTCSTHNIALLLLEKQFSFHSWEAGGEFIVNRVRYGASEEKSEKRIGDKTCRYFGWGSRRNGFLVPLLIDLYEVDVNILPQEECPTMWRGVNDDYICIEHPQCRTDKYGAMCPDDVGSILVCSGFVAGMMTNRMVDRPCGTGFLDLAKYNKFLTCGVDDSRDVINHEDYIQHFEYTDHETTVNAANHIYTVAPTHEVTYFNDSNESADKAADEQKYRDELEKEEHKEENKEEPDAEVIDVEKDDDI